MHAVPGTGSAQLTADGRKLSGAPGFSGVTGYTRVADGQVKLELGPPDGGKPLAQSEKSLSGGRYTVVAWRGGNEVRLDAYREEPPREGSARVRAIDVAGELGQVAVRLGDTSVTPALGAGKASPYRTVDPGSYDLQVRRAQGGGGALASRKGTAVAAGTATTAVVVGSGGEPTRVVLLSDGTAAPSKAPHTGLGGLSGGVAWGAVLAAALAAGAFGGAAYTLVRRRGA